MCRSFQKIPSGCNREHDILFVCDQTIEPRQYCKFKKFKKKSPPGMIAKSTVNKKNESPLFNTPRYLKNLKQYRSIKLNLKMLCIALYDVE